jgi:hypothetical protein
MGISELKQLQPFAGSMVSSQRMRTQVLTTLLTLGVAGWTCNPTAAAVRIEGQVQAGGAPLGNSTVTLWAANAGEPRQLAQARANSDGRFELGSQDTLGADVTLYLVAKGANLPLTGAAVTTQLLRS